MLKYTDFLQIVVSLNAADCEKFPDFSKAK